MTIKDLKLSLINYPQLHFYIYSAQKDGYVPVENFAEEINTIGSLLNVHYTNFLSTGHDEFYVEPQSWSDLLDNSKS